MAGFLTLGIVVTLSSPAHSADRPTIAVVGMHQDELGSGAQGRAVKALAEAIEEDRRFDALRPDDLAYRIGGRQEVILEEGLLAGAIEKLNAGKGMYNQASPEDAALMLQLAVDEFRLAMPATNTITALWEAWVYLGTCQLQRAEPDPVAAATAFRNAISLSPDRPLNIALFPPNVIEAYATERALLEAFPVTLEVTTDTLNATVFVDGVERGRSPMSIDGLLAGEHYVVVRTRTEQGYTYLPANVPVVEEEGPLVVRPPHLERIHVEMRSPSLGHAGSTAAARSQQVGALYTALGHRADDVTFVLAVGVDGDSLVMQLINGDTESLSYMVEVPFNDDALDEAIQALPLLLNAVTPSGGFSSVAAAAAPLDIGSNSELARLLLDGEAPTIPNRRGGGTDGKKGRPGLVLGLTSLAVLAAGAAGGGYYYATVINAPDPAGKVIVAF